MYEKWLEAKQRRERQSYFCPLCGQQALSALIQPFGWQRHLQITIITLVLMAAFFPIFGFKGLLIYLVVWAVYEGIFRLLRRKQLVCRNCGFDPFLFKRDAELSKEQVRQHIQYRIDAEGLFRNIKLKNYRSPEPKQEATETVAESVSEDGNIAAANTSESDAVVENNPRSSTPVS